MNTSLDDQIANSFDELMIRRPASPSASDLRVLDSYQDLEIKMIPPMAAGTTRSSFSQEFTSYFLFFMGLVLSVIGLLIFFDIEVLSSSLIASMPMQRMAGVLCFALAINNFFNSSTKGNERKLTPVLLNLCVVGYLFLEAVLFQSFNKDFVLASVTTSFILSFILAKLGSSQRKATPSTITRVVSGA